jgi:hypothetical protein
MASSQTRGASTGAYLPPRGEKGRLLGREIPLNPPLQKGDLSDLPLVLQPHLAKDFTPILTFPHRGGRDLAPSPKGRGSG